MSTTDFTTSMTVDGTPQEVFNAINNVRGWWSEDIEGGTAELNDEFKYRYKNVHQCRIRIIESIPGKKVLWQVMENYFNFTRDKSEWKDTKISFEISEKDAKTQLRFTHLGLTPEYECYKVCEDAWSNYIQNSLRKLVEDGKGEPNPKEGGYNEWLAAQHGISSDQDYQVTITVNATADEAFKRINDVRSWWTNDLLGRSENLNDEFSVRFDDIHHSTQKVTELVPGKKVVWQVTDSQLNFLKDKQEWTNTKIVFEIDAVGDRSQVRFTHIGLIPEIECYKDCSLGWDHFIKGSLFRFINEGKGEPGLEDLAGK